MGRAEAYLIPARFASTTGHILVVLILYSHIETNAISGLGPNPSSQQIRNASDDLTSAWIFALVCFFFDFLGIFSGATIFFRSANLFQIIMHFLGTLYTSWFILDEWSYSLYWKIVILFNLFPAIVEICLLISIFAFKVVQY